MRANVNLAVRRNKYSIPLLYTLIALLGLVYIEFNLVRVGGFTLTCQNIGLCGSGVVGQWLGQNGTGFHRVIQVITWPAIFLITSLALWVRRDEGLRYGPGLLLLPLITSLVQVGIAWSRIQVFTDPAGIVLNQVLILVMLGSVILAVSTRQEGQLRIKISPWRSLRVRQGGYTRLVVGAILVVFAAMVTGALATTAGGGEACTGWPLCDLRSNNPVVWLQMAHRGFSVLAAGLVGWVAVGAWKHHRTDVRLLVAATSAGILYAAQGLVGAMQALSGSDLYFSSLHSATSIAIWGVLVMVVVTAVYQRIISQVQMAIDNEHGYSIKSRSVFRLTGSISISLPSSSSSVLGVSRWAG